MTKVFTIEFDFMGSVQHAVVTMVTEEMYCYYVKLLDMDLLSFMPRIILFNQYLENQNVEWQHLNQLKESFMVKEVLKNITAAIQEQAGLNGKYFNTRGK